MYTVERNSLVGEELFVKKNIVFTIVTVMLCTVLFSCGKTASENGIWETATYIENTEFGEGSKTLVFDVVAEGKTVELTVRSDKETVGDALTEHGLISGEEGPYGLYVKTVNGMLADYDINKTYWSFTKNGEAMMQGVDTAKFEDGAHYEFTLTE